MCKARGHIGGILYILQPKLNIFEPAKNSSCLELFLI